MGLLFFQRLSRQPCKNSMGKKPFATPENTEVQGTKKSTMFIYISFWHRLVCIMHAKLGNNRRGKEKRFVQGITTLLHKYEIHHRQ